ncbi:MAG: hypothetical protein K2Q01_04570, partial [Rickettsiales bacterium]|nr:hypothetical protein [Rickettsiales bacterium]
HGGHEALNAQMGALERAYIGTVAATLRQEQNIDVVADASKHEYDRIGQSAGGGMGRNEGRITSAREPRGIPGLERRGRSSQDE